MTLINPAKLYSVMGNQSSLVPLMVKDLSATAGMTAGSFVTGKEEGQDRLIDELGTEIIWLGGIPLFKKIFDLTVFKAVGLDAKFDVRNFKDTNVLKKIEKFAPNKEIQEKIKKAVSKEKLCKGLATAKFFVSTSLAIATYVLLTKFKQKFTEKKIRQNLIKEYNEQQQNNAENNQTQQVTEKANPLNSQNFKGKTNLVEYFADPVRNMWILDGSITIERLKDSRTTQEFIGYAIKEASLLFFMYYAGGKIQELFEKHAEKKYNKTIGLDAKVLENDMLKQEFENGAIEKSLKEFDLLRGCTKPDIEYSARLYEFLHNKPDNMVVKVAKESDIIHMLKEKRTSIFKNPKKTDKIDTRKYIDLEKVQETKNNIQKLYNQYKEAISKGETSEEFFKSLKKLKRGSIKMNIFSSILALGVITPAIMVIKRLSGKDDAEFETKKRIREELIKEGVIK